MILFIWRSKQKAEKVSFRKLKTNMPSKHFFLLFWSIYQNDYSCEKQFTRFSTICLLIFTTLCKEMNYSFYTVRSMAINKKTYIQWKLLTVSNLGCIGIPLINIDFTNLELIEKMLALQYQDHLQCEKILLFCWVQSSKENKKLSID